MLIRTSFAHGCAWVKSTKVPEVQERNLYLVTGPGQGYREKRWKLWRQIERIVRFSVASSFSDNDKTDEGAS